MKEGRLYPRIEGWPADGEEEGEEGISSIRNTKKRRRREGVTVRTLFLPQSYGADIIDARSSLSLGKTVGHLGA